MKFKLYSLHLLSLLCLLTSAVSRAEPPYSGTIFLEPEIITSADPSTFTGLVYNGQDMRTMFDRRVADWVSVNAFIFLAKYSDGADIEIQVNPEYASAELAQVEAEYYAEVFGRLPQVLRKDVQTSWIHKGDEAFGGGNNNLLIHTGSIAQSYIDDGILEETLVHEASHTSLDAEHAASVNWIAAQQNDPDFISTYARDNPTREDIAESFLLWFAVRHLPGRISAEMTTTISTTIPNRLLYFDSLDFELSPFKDTFFIDSFEPDAIQ